MVNWTDHGVLAMWSTFSWASTAAWAPQAIPRDAKFYIYAPLSNKSGATVIGVGVATNPIGPYQDAIGQPLVTAGCSGGSGDIDPTVFIDDDGQAYLYFGRSVPGYVKLNSDMISYSGAIQCPTVNAQSFGPAPSAGGFPSQYEEGPWIMKHGGTYLLAYAANNIPEDIAYSKATAPGGPFTYVGTIMKATGASFTNHTGIIDFNGHSYFFYHDGALKSGGSVPSNGDGYHRSVCLEEFNYDADGAIPTISPTTGGPKAIANLNPYLKTEAETIAWESGVTTEVCSEGGMDVTSISSGDYIKVKNVDFGSGATSFEARVAASTAGGTIQIRHWGGQTDRNAGRNLQRFVHWRHADLGQRDVRDQRCLGGERHVLSVRRQQYVQLQQLAIHRLGRWERNRWRVFRRWRWWNAGNRGHFGRWRFPGLRWRRGRSWHFDDGWSLCHRRRDPSLGRHLGHGRCEHYDRYQRWWFGIWRSHDFATRFVQL